MRKSEYDTQAQINDGLIQQQNLDSQEGSAALSQPNKPEVDQTDIQKAQILAKADERQPVMQSLKPENQKKTMSRHRSPFRMENTSNQRKH